MQSNSNWYREMKRKHPSQQVQQAQSTGPTHLARPQDHARMPLQTQISNYPSNQQQTPAAAGVTATQLQSHQPRPQPPIHPDEIILGSQCSC